jgi:hypothetical protein
MRKIFQIGFNKCGTTSFHDLFERSGYRSIHWDEGRLAQCILANSDASHPLLTGYETYTFFFDMEWLTETTSIAIYLTHYQQLDREYPGSRFILNTRNIDAWIASRLRHKDFIDRFRRAFRQTRSQAIKTWRAEWICHHASVKAYFAARPESLLVYDLDNDSIDKLRVFLPEFNLLGDVLPHSNRTPSAHDGVGRKN